MLDNSRFEECSWLRWAADDIDEADICILGIPFDAWAPWGNHVGP